MKSVIPIDETWTIDTFRRRTEGANEILQNNSLPYVKNPYAAIHVQQEQYLEDAAKAINQTVIPYNELAHIQAVRQNLNDYDKSYAIAQITPSNWLQYLVTQDIPGFLTVPELMVTERISVEDAKRAQIMATASIAVIREILAPQPDLEIVGSDAGTGTLTSTDWFWKPTGDVMFSVEGDEPIEIPCWPESVKDSTSASWSQEMTTYQHYEPKNTYKGSGPRVVSCSFKLHRAMWNGNQDSGNAEKLIAYMESACYPDYDTQASEPPYSLLVIGGSIRIRGIMTSFDKTYQGPIGPDNKYDEVIINISITEVSDNILSTSAVRRGLAGWR